jgi:hypothetical protein
MEVDTDDQSEDDFKTSFEEQVSQLLHLTLLKSYFLSTLLVEHLLNFCI